MPLYCEGFLLMGCVRHDVQLRHVYLLAEPYSLSQAAVGFIFIVYLVGIFASAWIGSIADRVGREDSAG